MSEKVHNKKQILIGRTLASGGYSNVILIGEGLKSTREYEINFFGYEYHVKKEDFDAIYNKFKEALDLLDETREGEIES